MLTVESPRSMFDVLDTFDAVGLTEPLTGYLGERPVLAAKKWTLRRVPLDITADWHQDGAFLGDGRARRQRVAHALALRRHRARSRHRRAAGSTSSPRPGTEGAWFDWSVGDAVVARARRRRRRSCGRSSKPGDAILFDDMNLHRTAVDARDDARALRDRVVVLRAVALSRRADPGDVLTVARLSPFRRGSRAQRRRGRLRHGARAPAHACARSRPTTSAASRPTTTR